jgi:hypothetical protein
MFLQNLFCLGAECYCYSQNAISLTWDFLLGLEFIMPL